MQDLVDNILDDLVARVGKVRRWLVALGVLKTAALGLVGISLYVGLYAALDHRVHFGASGRLVALTLLVGLLLALSGYLVRTLRRDLTYSRAANYIEARQSFDQQLVAAVEYYEKGDDYPYSQGLARQLVVQVDAVSRDFVFDSTVEKWRGYLLAGCIVICLSVVGLFVHQNVVYFSAYLSRLVRPFSAIAPVAATALRSVAGDVVTAPDVPVALSAEVAGRTPESAELVLVRQGSAQPNEISPEPQRIALRPTVDAAGRATFAAAPSFDTVGDYAYRFETPDGATETHTISVIRPPAVAGITALVRLPNGTQRTEKIDGRTLRVLPHSGVELRVTATAALRGATIAGLDDQPLVQGLEGGRSFSVKLQADRAMSLTFGLTGVEGLANGEPEELQIALKSDEPPQFKLRSPEGDCLSTDVASIPIAFEITDDFGLDSAQLRCELPNGEALVLDTNEPKGAEQTRVSHTLELEEYDLQVGDSVLFYAQAGDVATGQPRTDARCCSDIYFIEIRPYRQYWHPQPGGGPSNAAGAVQDDLMTVLEYTRAILKKTWALAQTPVVVERDRPKFEALAGDVEYCIGTLASLRDDPEAGFDDSTKAAIDAVSDRHTQARRRLSMSDADGALPPEREAYRLLRKLIDELHLKWNPPQSGQSVPQEKPERITLQEKPDAQTPQDQQRTENQLEKLQQKIDKLARAQKSLKADLAKSLQEQSQSSGDSQPSESSSSSSGSSGRSSGQPGQPSASAKESAEGQDGRAPEQDAADQHVAEDRNQAGSKGEPSKANSASDQAQSDAAEPGAGRQQTPATERTPEMGPLGIPPSGGSESAEGGPKAELRTDSAPGQASDARSAADSQGGSADADARMRMLEAKQKALREQAADVSAELGQMALPEFSNHAGVRDQARQRLDQAVESMKAFEDKLADLRYDPGSSADKAGHMSDLADAAAQELAAAGKAIERGLAAGRPQTDAEKADAVARQLAEDAASLDKSVSPEEQERMLERLKAAERLLESMAGPQWATISASAGGGATHVYTKGGPGNQLEAARLLAQQFWSLAIQTRDRQMRPVEEEPSDVEFLEAENEFFENAAKFRPPGERQ